MTIQELRELARHAAHRTAPAEFSVSSVDSAVAEGFKNLTGSINNFMKNRYDIYDIIIENADEIVPAKVMDAMGQFAEVIQLKNGDTVLSEVSVPGGGGGTLLKSETTPVIPYVGIYDDHGTWKANDFYRPDFTGNYYQFE